MLALPKLPALTMPTSLSAPQLARQVRREMRLDRTGPTPGPPPPCGMQKVLCRFRCETSQPYLPGLATPTSAFMFAPSVYT